jgi:hypothetical protein
MRLRVSDRAGWERKAAKSELPARNMRLLSGDRVRLHERTAAAMLALRAEATAHAQTLSSQWS